MRTRVTVKTREVDRHSSEHPKDSRDLGGVSSSEPILLRAVKTPGPRWNRKCLVRKNREKRQENLGTEFANTNISMGATDTELGLGQAAYRTLFLGLSFLICKE